MAVFMFFEHLAPSLWIYLAGLQGPELLEEECHCERLETYTISSFLFHFLFAFQNVNTHLLLQGQKRVM